MNIDKDIEKTKYIEKIVKEMNEDTEKMILELLEELIPKMENMMASKDLSDDYLRENGHSTRDEIGIGEYVYGITMIPCDVVYPLLINLKYTIPREKKILSDLETWKKIAEKLASLIHKINDKEGCYIGKYGLVENCKGMTWCNECIIDWAKREVEKQC